MKNWTVGVVGFVMLSALGEAKGALLVDNGFSTAVSGGLTWQNFLDWRLFDDFSLGAPSAIQSVSYYMGLDNDPGQHRDIEFSIFNDNAGAVGTEIVSLSLSSSDYTVIAAPFGAGSARIDFSIASPINLAAGNYWASLWGTNGANSTLMASVPSNNGGDSFLQLRRSTGDFFVREGPDGAVPFQLIGITGGGAVPEPSTFVLWSLGAVALAGLGWRRRKRAA